MMRLFSILAASLSIFAVTLMLEPVMVDGDGLGHSSRAIYESFLSGMDPRHPLAAAFFRCFYLPLEALGLRRSAIQAFSLVDHACGVGIFLFLACSVFPRFIRSWQICLLSSLGVVLSYGVLSRASTIEVYAPAMLLDIALVAHCLRTDFARVWAPTITAILYVLAIGLHVTNVLMGPVVLAIVICRTPRGRIVVNLIWATFIFSLGISVILGLLWLGPGGARWPPDLAAILPRSEHHPQMSILGRLVRAVYGFLRTLAYLPYHRDLGPRGAGLCTAFLAGFATLFLVVVARGPSQRFRESRPLIMHLLLLALPFALVGLYYYPSDPERWIFLMPVVWLVIGIAWDQYTPTPGQWLSRDTSQLLLALIVLGLGGYNAIAGLLPDARVSRDLAGLKELFRLTTADDLVISPSSVRSRIHEFYVTQLADFENIDLVSLTRRHSSHREEMEKDLTDRITDALRDGRRVLVFDLIAEGHEKQRGYPWAFMENDYGPDTFLEVIARFDQEVLIQPSREQPGLFLLHTKNPHVITCILMYDLEF